MRQAIYSTYGRIISTAIFLLCMQYSGATGPVSADTPTSTQAEAIEYIQTIKSLDVSTYWPGVDPNLFLKNVQENIYHPLGLYEGTGTNFCGYAALSYLLLHDDPLKYANFIIQLYRQGKANWGEFLFKPSIAVRKAAGTLKFKGALDIRPAEQMWFLSLADHFKGYLNVFNHHYSPGDENTFWAAVNYSKFNRMVEKMSAYHVSAKGSDLLRPWIFDLNSYIQRSMETGITVLYLNNTVLHKQNHNRIRASIPTHYIILLDLSQADNGLVNITYWDYGFRTLRQLTPGFLKKIVFGVSHCTKKNKQ